MKRTIYLSYVKKWMIVEKREFIYERTRTFVKETQFFPIKNLEDVNEYLKKKQK